MGKRDSIEVPLTIWGHASLISWLRWQFELDLVEPNTLRSLQNLFHDHTGTEPLQVELLRYDLLLDSLSDVAFESFVREQLSRSSDSPPLLDELALSLHDLRLQLRETYSEQRLQRPGAGMRVFFMKAEAELASAQDYAAAHPGLLREPYRRESGRRLNSHVSRAVQFTERGLDHLCCFLLAVGVENLELAEQDFLDRLEADVFPRGSERFHKLRAPRGLKTWLDWLGLCNDSKDSQDGFTWADKERIVGCIVKQLLAYKPVDQRLLRAVPLQLAERLQYRRRKGAPPLIGPAMAAFREIRSIRNLFSHFKDWTHPDVTPQKLHTQLQALREWLDKLRRAFENYELLPTLCRVETESRDCFQTYELSGQTEQGQFWASRHSSTTGESPIPKRFPSSLVLEDGYPPDCYLLKRSDQGSLLIDPLIVPFLPRLFAASPHITAEAALGPEELEVPTEFTLSLEDSDEEEEDDAI